MPGIAGQAPGPGFAAGRAAAKVAAMRILGFSFSEFLKIGLAASLFILAAKWLGPKTGVPALAQTTQRI